MVVEQPPLSQENSLHSFTLHFQFILAVMFCFIAYIPMWIWMWDRWFTPDSYYSHGVLVPLVTAYLIWQKKEMLARIEFKRSRWGITLIGAGAILYLISSIFQVYFFSAFSLLFVTMGLVLHYYGQRILRAIIVPILFIGFMIPLPLVLVVNISFQMKLFTTELATRFLNAVGLFAVQEGSIIIMHKAHMVIDDVCSGLRSLISLMALGTLFAYWLKGQRWKKAVLILLAIPVAVITNVCRIVFLALVSEGWGPQHAGGLLHDISGYFVFALAFGCLYWVDQLLE